MRDFWWPPPAPNTSITARPGPEPKPRVQPPPRAHLTDAAIRGAKPGPTPRKLFDSGGLYLLVAPSGGRWWRMKYRVGGKEKKLSLGVYPAVTLRMARDRRDAARRQLAEGQDPGAARKEEGETFELVAREWLERFAPSWTREHRALLEGRLERDVFPWLGERPIRAVTASELLAALRRIEARGAPETAKRIRVTCGQVFRFAVATGRAERDPTSDLRGALPPSPERHFASLTEPAAVGGLLRAIDAYQGHHVTRCALKLAPLTFVRPGELR